MSIIDTPEPGQFLDHDVAHYIILPDTLCCCIDTPEPGDWEEAAREVRGDARQHQEALDQVFPLIFLKG